MKTQLLLVECDDRPGLVHAVTGVLLRWGCNVTSNQEFVDRSSVRFFMRTEFTGPEGGTDIPRETAQALPPGAIVRMSSLQRRRVTLLASREHHCVADLLVRHAFGELNANVVSVVSNHPDLEKFVGQFGIPFHLISHEGLSREEHEARLRKAIAPEDPEYLVLAKYMRIVTPSFIEHYPGRIINIHHSFLPAFIGAKPYLQAFQRGVKVIGATAHFVTEELDAGPIIAQEVLSVDHTHSATDLAQAGREVERLALARALKLVFEERVFLCGNRTVIFD